MCVSCVPARARSEKTANPKKGKGAPRPSEPDAESTHMRQNTLEKGPEGIFIYPRVKINGKKGCP